MKRMQRLAPLVASLGLVVAIGLVGLFTSRQANTKAQAVHLEDRVTLERTLAGLANQYFQFTLKEAFDFASSQKWNLRAGDPADTQNLERFVTHAALLQHGAALVGLTGQPLATWSHEPGLPPATDPGYNPLQLSLLAGKPGFSSVMHVGEVPIVAVAVPVMRGKTPLAIFVAFFRADKSPLQTYNERLRYGATGKSYLVDGSGSVIAANDPSLLGKVYPAPAVLKALAAGKTGDTTFVRNGVTFVSAYSPVGVGGWGTVVEQRASEFFGPISSGGFRVALALLALLVAAAAGLAVLNQRRQSALRHAYDYKGQLLANTTHELKTPLTAIRGAAMTLGTRWRDMKPDQVDTFLGIIHRRCDGLGKLIERILMGARLEAGRELQVQPEPTAMIGALRRIADEFNDAGAHHEIVVDAATDVWTYADGDALDQILGLLVENAIKYSPDGGEVRLRAENAGDHVTVTVTDHGIGIADDDLEHVFDAYFKAHRGATASFAGVGLGLSIARHLVERHGGEMTVSSVLGHGSTFAFTLPKCDPPSLHKITLVEAG